MTRQIVLDTETTGLEVNKGHRLVEIGCLEYVERRPTGRRFHRYLNPQRAMDAGASEVTGLSDDFLVDKPVFAEVAQELIEFIRGAELIIHNASFDVGFLDAEIARVDPGLGSLRNWTQVTDTLAMARERYPGQRNSLDALCKRLGVDNGHRTLHGALLDAELLAEVYLAMTSGQGALSFDLGESARSAKTRAPGMPPRRLGSLKVRRADAIELAAHEGRLAALRKGGRCLWPEPAVEPTAG